MIGILGGMGTQAGLDFCNKLAKINAGKLFLEGKWGKLYNKSNIPIDVIISQKLQTLLAWKDLLCIEN
jgi:aspartate/glutamate racemase